MSDEKPLTEDPHSHTHTDHEPAAAETTSKLAKQPALILGCIIIALLGGLIVMSLRGSMGGSSAGESEINDLKAKANALHTQLNSERVAMGLRPIEGSYEPVADIAARLKKDADTMVALAGSFQSMLAEKDLELKAKSTEIINSEQIRKSIVAESARLQAELQRALVNGSAADALRRDFETMKSQRDALAAELDTMRKDLAAKSQGIPEDEFADLKRRFEETQRAKDFFEAKVKELESQLAKPNLFANSENELLPAAVELFRSLRQLENRPASELTNAYSNLGTTLNANVLHTFNFATGSSSVAPADEELIRNLAQDIPDGDLLLAIGYASETGNVDGNRKLSSERATAVAQVYSTIKRPTQLVQAVYLGQTDRFDTRIPESNQVVEIWRIRKK